MAKIDTSKSKKRTANIRKSDAGLNSLPRTEKSKTKKSKVKKYYGGNFIAIEDAFHDCTNEEIKAMNIALEEFMTGYDIYSFLEELFGITANILDGIGTDGYDVEKSKTKKSKVRKSGILMHREALSTFKKLIQQLRDDGADDAFGFDELYNIYEESVEYYNEMVEEDGGDRFYKSMTTKDMIKALKEKGYAVFKAEDEVSGESEDDEPTEDDMEESSEVDEIGEESEEDVEINVDVDKSKKSIKRRMTGAEVLKSKGWVRKTDDNGPTSEDVEEEAIGESVPKVPDTKEPTENVEDTATGMPEIDDIQEDSTPKEDLADNEGGDMDAIEPEGGEAKMSIDSIIDEDIDVLIEKKRMQKEKAQKGLSDNVLIPGQEYIKDTKPFTAPYRTVQRGEGKMAFSTAVKPRANIGKARKN